jgi:rRNA biogenesis protein RRP5
LFAWDDFELSASKNSGKGDDDSSDEDDDEDDDEYNGKKKKSANSKKRAREDEENLVRQKELDLLQKQESSANDEWEDDDFERALLATPNDSALWVRYMASKLRSLDLVSCRSIANRALKTILFREEEEKFNIWVAFINLEFKYGTKQSLTEVIQSACTSSHPKRIRLRVASMLEEAHLDSGEGSSSSQMMSDEIAQEAEAAYAVAAKKHKTSKQVWSAYIRYRLRTGDDMGASKLLERAIQCLSKHKHVYVISRFAQDEFAFGSVERGRTVFEELLAVHGLKRLDLWNVYIDKEIKVTHFVYYICLCLCDH